MIPQRAHVAESWVKVQIIKWTVEGAVKGYNPSILQRLSLRK